MANDSSIDPSGTRLLELGDRLVAMALKQGASVAECVVREGVDLSAKVRLGEAELVEQAGHRSAGLRVMRGKQVATTSTSDLSESGLARFVSDALELAELAQEDPFAGPADPKLLADMNALPQLDLFDPSAEAIDAKEALAIAKRGEDAARAHDSRITNSEGATFGRTAGGSAMVLSNGFRGYYRGSYQSLSVVPVADDADGKKRRGYHWTARRHLKELDDSAAVGREAARRALQKLGARTVPTGEVAVVFDPDAARGILGMMASCIMGGAIWRKSSYLVGREGTRVASDLIDIVDDPLMPRAPGSRPYDGEGLLSRRNVVVEKGILKTYLCDSYSARKLSRESTASAARGGSAGVGGGTSNFIMKPGKDSHDAIVSGTKRGLYVTEMMGFGFNAITGDFSRGAAGFWIENGELTFPVSEVTIRSTSTSSGRALTLSEAISIYARPPLPPTFRVAKMTLAGG